MHTACVCVCVWGGGGGALTKQGNIQSYKIMEVLCFTWCVLTLMSMSLFGTGGLGCPCIQYFFLPVEVFSTHTQSCSFSAIVVKVGVCMC